MTTATQPTGTDKAKRPREKAGYVIQLRHDDVQGFGREVKLWHDIEAGPFETTAKAEAHIRKSFKDGTFRVIRVTAQGTVKVKTVERATFG